MKKHSMTFSGHTYQIKEGRKMTQYLKEKEEGCLNLAIANVKKVDTTMIRNEAESQGVSYFVMRNAWQNYMEFGQPDLRDKGKNTITPPEKLQKILNWQKENRPYFPARDLTSKQAGKILKDYVFTNKSSYEVMTKHKISSDQFYSLIRELNVSGTVLGRKVLDPKQYAKIDIKKVIKFHKKPHLFNNESVLEIGRFQRVLVVLKKYL